MTEQNKTEQSDAGKLLCLASKNVEQDVFDIFERHPDMLLRRDESAVGTPSALLIVAERRPQCRRSSPIHNVAGRVRDRARRRRTVRARRRA